MSGHEPDFMHKLDKSAILTVIGVVLLFSGAVIVTLIAPSFIDPSWTSPTCNYQVQMYEVVDPNVYISNPTVGGYDLQFVHHLKADYTLLSFQEASNLRIIAPEDLQKYITRHNDPKLILTSRLLLLRKPQKSDGAASFDAIATADTLRKELQEQWEKQTPDWKEKGLPKPDFDILELYVPEGHEAFAYISSEGNTENWASENYQILDESPNRSYHRHSGVIYVNNPREYRIKHYKFGREEGWYYDPEGEKIKDLKQLTSSPLEFRSRQELIKLGEHLFAIEGCWYCHTDQTRTLVQDVVLNGSDSYPAPPSSANEYIYQEITFPGTRRIGPDLSRVGVKRPSRDWHKSHFWSPKTESKGSIMPSFHHFFDADPRGTHFHPFGIPNYRFEAIFQYLMTKGTRITPPNEAWWLGKDPVKTKEIIEGRKVIPR